MQAYGPGFSRIYNLRWGDFAHRVAPALRIYYETTPRGRVARQDMPSLLDLCCGAGHLAAHFLEQGYQVTGMDLSPGMLEYARQNNAAFIVAGQARFVEGDAAHYTLDQPVDLVLSTFDALNHLPDMDALCGCFTSTCRALKPGGTFIFDLNTRLGLQRWATINLQEAPDLTLVTSGLYDSPRGKAYTRIAGFIRAEDGRYDRFEETVYNTAFDMAAIQPALLEAGFHKVHFARLADLAAPIEDPEAESRAWIVAER
jgi:SAM-dependent methyltransferase